MALHTVDRLEELPDPVPDADFVVVDVVTASTSIIRLLDAGARYVRPFADADAARAFGRETDGAVLVGEENGAPVEGFDLLPLPTGFEAAELDDRPVAIYTTNGTRAVDRIGDRHLLIGSTINAAAVAARIRERDRETWLVGAGYHGSRAPEDAAGVSLIEAYCRDEIETVDSDVLCEQIQESPPAAWLRDLGFGADIEAILEFDSTKTVPTRRNGVFVAE